MTARVVGSLFIAATAAGLVSTATQGTARDLCVFLMAVAIAFIAPTLFPVLKPHGEALALGYVVARTLEVVFLTTATAQSAIYFCVSVVLLNVVLYRSKLVPRWISVWALIAVVPYLAGAVLNLLNVFTQTQVAALFVPLALNEMVLALWLMVKGFSRSA
ncbi:DUF4386 domain-containing protein [Lentzea sp. NPDC051838]|uniref:DUF4386 domain-containing protein n=1 Tax=Lentzea sp. NPDC051838 TaxID=3154849 RepID=UPI0034238A01